MIIDVKRKVSTGMPNNLTIVDRNRVKKVKLAIKPTTTPSGLFLPEVSTEDESIIGSIGRIHGERIVAIPAKKAKAKSRIIYMMFFNSSLVLPPFHLVISLPSWSI